MEGVSLFLPNITRNTTHHIQISFGKTPAMTLKDLLSNIFVPAEPSPNMATALREFPAAGPSAEPHPVPTILIYEFLTECWDFFLHWWVVRSAKCCRINKHTSIPQTPVMSLLNGGRDLAEVGKDPVVGTFLHITRVSDKGPQRKGEGTGTRGRDWARFGVEGFVQQMQKGTKHEGMQVTTWGQTGTCSPHAQPQICRETSSVDTWTSSQKNSFQTQLQICHLVPFQGTGFVVISYGSNGNLIQLTKSKQKTLFPDFKFLQLIE